MNKTTDPETGEEIEDYSQVNEYKKAVYDEVFNLAYHGNGGWNWTMVYNLPIHIRRYCLKLLQQTKEKESEAIKKTSTSDSGKGIPKIPKSVYDAINTGQNPPRRQPK